MSDRHKLVPHALALPLCWQLVLLPALAALGDPASPAQSPRLQELESAARRYEAQLSDDPQDFDALLGAARALNGQMAIRTNGNLPLIDGLQDSDANRALWSELGSRALAHARAAHALKPDSVVAAAALANAYMFYASSLGILRSILSGAGGEYREHATRLVELGADYDDGLGDYLLASFYLVAPWPVGDGDAARAHYERAIERSPESVRNLYGLGVYWAREGDAGRARPYFERCLHLPCSDGSEQLFCDWIKQESRRALGEL